MRNRLTTLVTAGALAALAPLAPVGAQQSGPAAWWRSLGDTALAGLTEQALAANHDVRAALARVDRARAARRNAAFDLAPTVTVAAGYSHQRTSSAAFGFAIPDRDLWDAEVRANWEVDLFGRLRGTLRGEGALTDAASADADDVRRAIAAELALAWFDLKGAEQRLAVAQGNADNQRRTLALARELLDAGRGTEFDTERAAAQLATTLASVPALEAFAAAARHRIAVLVGQPPADDGFAGGGLDALPVELPAFDIAVAVAGRPDVRAAERRVAASGAFVGAAKAEYLPRLTVGASAGYTATALGQIGDAGTGRYLVGPVLSWPALNIGRVKKAVDAARATEAEAREAHRQVMLLAQAEIATALAGYRGARQQLALLAEAAGASERAAELARLRFEEGLTDFLPVLDAERTLLAAQDRLARVRTEAEAALVAVSRATAGGAMP